MILYHYESSSHSRFVLLVARNLDVDLEVNNIVKSMDTANYEDYARHFRSSKYHCVTKNNMAKNFP